VRTIHLKAGAMLLGAFLMAAPAGVSAAPDTARLAYTRALGQERLLREETNKATLSQIRRAIAAYETVVRKFPASGYSDNALWQASNLALLAYERFGQAADKRAGLRLLAQLRTQYPSSSLIAGVDDTTRQFEAVNAAPVAADSGIAPVSLPAPHRDPDAAIAVIDRGSAAAGAIALRGITRTPLPDGMRVTIELDAESTYRAERLERPRRVFFDLKNVRPVPALQDATLRFPDDIVREIRLGRHPQNTTRVVMDMAGLDTYSVFTLYDPFRLVIDFQRSTAAPLVARPQPGTPPPAAPSTPPPGVPVVSGPAVGSAVSALPLQELPIRLTPPALPSANSNGQFSLARQLGLGVSRIVIDAGHGGHDPGARANGLSEAELVLDVAQRLAKLLQKQPGVEVVLTRDRDVFIPLEERTAIANREGADLFLSIHANAASNSRARGVESYFLNFAPNAAAEAIAARENAGSTRTMHNLPEIVKAIALNNKINESRDFAAMVQRSMVRRLSPRNSQLKDLGVKQAPFVVLIGAGMPSVLAEISFVTHKQEAQLLKSGPYRQLIAEALLEAVLKYQQSLKKPRAVAATR
jgi:N-acetylmuramoyl-L-alanine amidase